VFKHEVRRQSALLPSNLTCPLGLAEDKAWVVACLMWWHVVILLPLFLRLRSLQQVSDLSCLALGQLPTSGADACTDVLNVCFQSCIALTIFCVLGAKSCSLVPRDLLNDSGPVCAHDLLNRAL